MINKRVLLSTFTQSYRGYDPSIYTKSPRLNKDNFHELFHNGCGPGWGRDDNDKRYVKVWDIGTTWEGEFVTGWHDASDDLARLEYQLRNTNVRQYDLDIITNIYTRPGHKIKTKQELIDYIDVLKYFIHQDQEYIEYNTRSRRNELLTELLT